MGLSELLGWVKTVSDTFGLTSLIQGFVILTLVAIFVNSMRR